MASFAEGTDVPAERSRAEIEKLLDRYGATRYVSGWDREHATIAFSAQERHVRFMLPLPRLEDSATSPAGRKRDARATKAAHEAEVRRRWRSLALVIKAKLEAVQSGVSTFEAEFLAHVLLPSGETVGSWISPYLEEAQHSKKMPPPLMLEAPKKDPHR